MVSPALILRFVTNTILSPIVTVNIIALTVLLPFIIDCPTTFPGRIPAANQSILFGST